MTHTHKIHIVAGPFWTETGKPVRPEDSWDQVGECVDSDCPVLRLEVLEKEFSGPYLSGFGGVNVDRHYVGSLLHRALERKT